MDIILAILTFLLFCGVLLLGGVLTYFLLIQPKLKGETSLTAKETFDCKGDVLIVPGQGWSILPFGRVVRQGNINKLYYSTGGAGSHNKTPLECKKLGDVVEVKATNPSALNKGKTFVIKPYDPEALEFNEWILGDLEREKYDRKLKARDKEIKLLKEKVDRYEGTPDRLEQLRNQILGRRNGNDASDRQINVIHPTDKEEKS